MRSMTMLRLFVMACFVFIAGCATAPKMNRLGLGMSKQEVLSIMGRPDSTSVCGEGTEILHYKLSPQGGPIMNLVTEDYIVRIVSGKVVAFGKAQDLESQTR